MKTWQPQCAFAEWFMFMNKQILLRVLRNDPFVHEQVNQHIRMASSAKWDHNEQQFHDCSQHSLNQWKFTGMQMLKNQNKTGSTSYPLRRSELSKAI